MNMFTYVVENSAAGKQVNGDVGSVAQLEGMIALIYTYFKTVPNDDYDIYQVVTDWFEAVWEVTPYESHEYAHDLCEWVFGVLIEEDKQ